MIVETLEQLPRLPAEIPLTVDVETVSYDDIGYGHAFDGKTRVCGYAICDPEKNTWYIPLRHRSAVKNENLPLEPTVKWLQETLQGRHVINHNIKFDAKVWQHDGIKPAVLEDTMVLARLVECDRFSYSLDSLAKDYLGERKTSDPVKAYLASLTKEGRKDEKKARKDYGLVPANILGPYAENDVRLTWMLREKLRAKIKKDTESLMQAEIELTWWMSKWECIGIPVNQRAIKMTWRQCLRQMMELTQQAIEIVGEEFDLANDTDLSKVLIGKYQVVPKAFTKKQKRPQWNGMALRTLDGSPEVKQLGNLIATYRNTAAFASSFCDGWLKRCGTDGRLHADFRIAGTSTGRLSCADPNMQNVSPRAENFVEVGEGRIIIAYDYSQIEYRIFGHYTDDPVIVNEYRNNPEADFHGFLAGVLGVDRQFAKQLNFSFLYGMGREKLLRNLSGILTLKADESDEMREKMRLMAYGAGTSISERAKQLDASAESKLMAEGIYNTYHRKFPSIRMLQRRITSCIRTRGWIRNYFGRYYYLPEVAVHKGVNYLIQGTAADLFKNRILAVFKDLSSKYDFTMITNVHDSVIFDVKLEHAKAFYFECRKILEADLGFRLPIKVEGKVATLTWGKIEKVKGDDFDGAVEKSRTTMTRLAGLARHDWDKDDGKTTGRYDFSGTGN